MPDHLFTIAAQGHAVDAQTNMLTIFSVVEEVGAPSLPVAIPQLSVVTLWRRRKGEEGVSFVQRTVLINPDGNEVFRFDHEFRLDKLRHRSIGSIGMVPFEKTGSYTLRVEIRKADESAFSTATEYPLEVVQISNRQSSLLTQATN